MSKAVLWITNSSYKLCFLKLDSLNWVWSFLPYTKHRFSKIQNSSC